jgi:hypothetical protein
VAELAFLAKDWEAAAVVLLEDRPLLEFIPNYSYSL